MLLYGILFTLFLQQLINCDLYVKVNVYSDDQCTTSMYPRVMYFLENHCYIDSGHDGSFTLVQKTGTEVTMTSYQCKDCSSCVGTPVDYTTSTDCSSDLFFYFDQYLTFEFETTPPPSQTGYAKMTRLTDRDCEVTNTVRYIYYVEMGACGPLLDDVMSVRFELLPSGTFKKTKYYDRNCTEDQYAYTDFHDYQNSECIGESGLHNTYDKGHEYEYLTDLPTNIGDLKKVHMFFSKDGCDMADLLDTVEMNAQVGECDNVVSNCMFYSNIGYWRSVRCDPITDPNQGGDDDDSGYILKGTIMMVLVLICLILV